MPVSTPMPSSIGANIRLAPSPPAASSAAPSLPTITLSTKTVAIWDRKAMAIGIARARLAPASSIQVARPAGRAVAPAARASRLSLKSRCFNDLSLVYQERKRANSASRSRLPHPERQTHGSPLQRETDAPSPRHAQTVRAAIAVVLLFRPEAGQTRRGHSARPYRYRGTPRALAHWE